MLSFAVMGAALCADMVPRMSPGAILRRLGLAPGASAHPRVQISLTRWLAYSGDSDFPASSELLVRQLCLTVLKGIALFEPGGGSGNIFLKLSGLTIPTLTCWK
jgi:hypothetical protein